MTPMEVESIAFQAEMLEVELSEWLAERQDKLLAAINLAYRHHNSKYQDYFYLGEDDRTYTVACDIGVGGVSVVRKDCRDPDDFPTVTYLFSFSEVDDPRLAYEHVAKALQGGF